MILKKEVWNVFRYIAENPNSYQLEIAKATGQISSASVICNRLLKLGLISLELDLSNRKIKRYILTPLGLKVFENIKEIENAISS